MDTVTKKEPTDLVAPLRAAVMGQGKRACCGQVICDLECDSCEYTICG